jgi:phage terminase large subunit-like protein
VTKKTPKTQTTINTSVEDARAERRALCESDLEEFIKLVHPNRLLGNIHRDVIRWWTSDGAKNHQLLLMPRDHMKSALIAYMVAWELTKDPTLRVLYISSTSNLATKQLKFIKDIFTNDTYRLYWPEMVEKDEAKREKWTEREISLDHPRRKEEFIRDPSIFTAGLTSNIVGLHCDISVLDDVVVQGNAYMEDSREKVRDQYSLLSSIETVGAREWIVGTRYHPKDLYSSLIEMEVDEYDELGNVHNRYSLFDVRQYVVESAGDGTGEFLWPRQQRNDGKWFGFDTKVLGDKRAQYLNKIHFRAQYYNDPHDVDSSPIQRDQFQYYDKQFVNRKDGVWYFKRERLNVFAAVDFAYSTGKKADYTSIVVVGVDGQSNYYILDIDRFKTDKISEYYNRILKLHEEWGFRNIRAEVSAAQAVIVKDLKENYIRPNGIALAVEEFRPSRWTGAKEERIMAVLEPKYANRSIWHYAGGYCQYLEEELIFANPAHDDIKDALASAVDFAKAPVNSFRQQKAKEPAFNFHSRWGGVA